MYITLSLAFNEGLLNKTIPHDVYRLSIEVVHVCEIWGFRSGGNEHLESPSIWIKSIKQSAKFRTKFPNTFSRFQRVNCVNDIFVVMYLLLVNKFPVFVSFLLMYFPFKIQPSSLHFLNRLPFLHTPFASLLFVYSISFHSLRHPTSTLSDDLQNMQLHDKNSNTLYWLLIHNNTRRVKSCRFALCINVVRSSRVSQEWWKNGGKWETILSDKTNTLY